MPESSIESAFQSRFDVELAWLATLDGLTLAAARILAARVAASQAGLTGDADERRVQSWLCADRPAWSAGHAVDMVMSAAQVDTALTDGDRAHIERAWPVCLAVETLLASGGDERLTLDGALGLNRYGCAPWPRPDIVGFASCTASSPSRPAFLAAESARRSLIEAALAAGAASAVARASRGVAEAVLAHFGVADLADAILSASGTDAALIVTGLLAADHPQAAMTSVLVSPAETGSGVPDAVQARHFAGAAPSGRMVAKGGLVDGLSQPPRLVTIGLRDGAGTPLGAADVARACADAVQAALQHGRVVLHAIDGSKTGLTAPGRQALLDLAARFGDRLDIVVDACQARIEPALVRWYLGQGFPVLVTGSKFFAAPGFCGAILFPRARLARIVGGGAVAGGLAQYASLEGGLSSRRCPGLVLRWSAALHEMASFAALPAAEVALRLERAGTAVERLLAVDGRLRLIAAPRPLGMGWSDRRSVFTFSVRQAEGWMDPSSLRRLYLDLQDDRPNGQGQVVSPPCQLGQPVVLGSAASGGTALGGLRIAFSAAQIGQPGDHAAALGAVFDRLRLALDTLRDSDRAGAPALVAG